MSALGLERSHTANANDYDHAIGLVDDTKIIYHDASVDETGDGNADASSDLSPVSRTESGTLLSHQWTKGHLRKELARRKYAKWQEGRDDDSVIPATNSYIGAGEGAPGQASQKNTTRSQRLRNNVPFRSKKKKTRQSSTENAFIDVLYENQRGGWFCGIPLYSSKSLLNFDPSGWQTATYKDSAVNITNAQLPDPSWEWEWRCWYVDMSYDVDDEGWQYSFNFGSGWEWHGNHPWFHSFVRRRRWLRKRTRIHPHHRHLGNMSNANDAHLLNSDYFTIHTPQRDRSRGSSTDRNTTKRSSLTGEHRSHVDSNQDLTDISNITALMNALKNARLDREKISAVRMFLDQGAEELFYLADSIPTIMADVVHQTSRRQLQTLLLKALDNIPRLQPGSEDDEKDVALQSKAENLLKAIEAAGVHANDFHYWSTLETRWVRTEDRDIERTHALDATERIVIPSQRVDRESQDALENQDGIEGISESAQISQEPSIGFDNSSVEEKEGSTTRVMDKGKGRE